MKHLSTSIMKRIICALSLLLTASAGVSAALIDDGVYSISCQQREGYVALGAEHNVNPYICYLMDGSELTDDAYWEVTNTDKGCTLRNVFSGQWLVYTNEREDQYYKYMTLSDTEPSDGSHLWIVSQNSDGTLSLESAVAAGYFWNLRANQGLLGTYKGSSRSTNERFTFALKEDTTPTAELTDLTQFPAALHVHLSDGRLEAYPKAIVSQFSQTDGQLVVTTTFGQVFTYAAADVDSVREQAPTDFPTFESFKFNNKFNDQLFADCLGEMVGDTVFLTVAAIGKRLTPSFKVPDDQTEVYVNGVRQDSKVSRLRFDKDIYYVVTRPGCTMLLPDANGDYTMQPYGRMVRVHVDWLTDHADVPRIDITTANGDGIYTRDYYEDATISINGQGAFPDMEATDVQIKGRGNSSWGWPKKPYRLKFSQKVKPLGMKKGKNWVLLSNYQTGSQMTNAIGMKAANLMGAAAANHIVPVDLYINGEYQGSYNLTEKVGLSNNSVELMDETAAALLEFDSYYDEPDGQKFHSVPYNLPINVKEPDFETDDTRLTLDMVETDFNSFLTTLSRGEDISRHVDVEQLVRFLMVNELINNYEIYHPKSTFSYRESFESDTSKYVFGPVWDLDWAFGYEGHSRYFQDNENSNYWFDMPSFEARQFVQDLRFKYAPVGDLYRQLWEQFMEEDLTELLEFCKDYYDFAHQSFERNRSVWNDYTDYQQQVSIATSWLQTRADQIYADILSDIRPGSDEPVFFDNNKLYTITSRRGAMVLNQDHTGLDIESNRYYLPEQDRRFAILNIDGHNYLYSPAAQCFLDCRDNGTWVEQLGSELIITATRQGSQPEYKIQGYTGGYLRCFNHNGKKISIDSWTTLDDGNQWTIEAVADFDPTEALQLAAQELCDVTIDYAFEGQVVHSEVIQVTTGCSAPQPTLQSTDFYDIQLVGEEPESIDSDCHLTYELLWHGPFEFTRSKTDVHWYNMTIRSTYYVAKNELEPYYPTSDVSAETLQQPEYQWAFGGDPLHILVYNRSTALGQVLTCVGSDAVMRQGDYSWDILSNSDGFVLRQHDTEWTCINQLGGGGGALGFWNDYRSTTDNGSTFRIMDEVEVDYVLGDANGDGKVSITDAVFVVNYVLKQPADTFCFEPADVNGDGKITITDAVAIVNIVLSQGEQVKALEWLEPQ